MFSRPESFKYGRQALSNLLLLCFIVGMVLAGAYSEFFQTPRRIDGSAGPWQQLFSLPLMNTVQDLELTNKWGTFRFQKREKDGQSTWDMSHPRQLNADDSTINKIIASIEQIQVLKVYPKDPINLSHYALDNPATTLKFNYRGGEQAVLKTGLVNPIDNSTYMTLTGKEPLFHIEKLGFSMDSLKLTDFIDSTVFSSPRKDVVKIQIYRGSRRRLSARLMNGQWFNQRGRFFDSEKMEGFLNQLFSLRSQLILDETTEKMEKEIRRHISRALYTVHIGTGGEQMDIYKISRPLSRLADIKIEKGQNSLVTGPQGSHPNLIGKEHLEIFNVEESRLYQKRN